jgi:hypothetical protein
LARDLEQLYAEYNDLYFEGKLPTIPVKWGKVHKNHDAEFVTYVDGSLAIVLTPGLKKFPRFAYIRVLHEMIHVKQRDLKGDLHGPKFQREMKRLARVGAFDGLW